MEGKAQEPYADVLLLQMGTTHSFRPPENTRGSLAALLATSYFKDWPEMMRS